VNPCQAKLTSTTSSMHKNQRRQPRNHGLLPGDRGVRSVLRRKVPNRGKGAAQPAESDRWDIPAQVFTVCQGPSARERLDQL
jgi:hypothetical protein